MTGTEKRGITIEDLFEMKWLGDPRLSPDADQVVFVRKQINEDGDYESHLFVEKLSNQEMKQWTFGNGKDHSPRWSPDGKSLAFLSNRSGRQQIWLLSTEGGEARQLTACKNGVSDHVWSPCGGKLLFKTSLGEAEKIDEAEESGKDRDSNETLRPLEVTRLRYKSDASGFLEHKKSYLATIDLDSEKINLLTDGDEEIESAVWAPDGSRIAFAANRTEDPDNTFTLDIYIHEVMTGKEQKITDGTGYFSTINWSRDGRLLSALGHKREYEGATLSRFWTFHLDNGEENCMTQNWDALMEDAMIGDMHSGNPNPGAVWDKDGKGVYVIVTDKGNTGLYHVSLDAKTTPVVTGDFHLYAVTVDPDSGKAVVGISSPTEIGDLYEVDLFTGEKKQITSVNRDLLEKLVLTEPESFTYESFDGMTVQGWMLKPATVKKGEKVPLVLEIHGGPHAMYGNTFFHELQVLAAKGYAVLYTNPRGSDGYGQQFVNACRGDYGGGDYRDIMNGLDAAIEKYDFIDTDRLGVTGGSYGGFMTNWIIGQTDRFKAAVTQRSISNWFSFYGVSDIGYFFTKWEVGAHLFEDPEKLWQHSPIRLVNDMKTPLLILHSEKDYRCPVEQAEQLFVALKHLGRDVKFVRFPEQNHELSRNGKPEMRKARLEYLTDWFGKHL